MPAPIIPLSRSGRRTLVASMLHTATDEQDPLTAQLLADVLDQTSAAVLRAAGLEDDEARAILASLWTE